MPPTDLVFALTYDKAGNLATEGRANGLDGATTWIYTHDAWNKLVKVETGATPVTKAIYKYNGLRFIIKQSTTLGAGIPGLLDR